MPARVGKAPEAAVAMCEEYLVRNEVVSGIAEGGAQGEVAGISQERMFQAGETIIDQGANVRFVGNILTGILRIVRSLPDGRSHIVELLHPPDFFGRLYAESSEFSIEAATKVKLRLIDRNAFEAILAKHPNLKHELYLASLADSDDNEAGQKRSHCS